MNYILQSNLTISTEQIVISISIAAILGVFIYFIYRFTYKGDSYSSSFGQSLVYTSIITAMIMATIQSNLTLSLGMVGSRSIIRFRTAVKEARDLIFVFWAVGVGVSAGAAVFAPGLVGTLIVAIFMVVFSFDIYEKINYLIVVSTDEK